MEKMTLIHWTGAAEPGEPWEGGWEVKPLVSIPAAIVQGRAVYRAPAGTQLPEGAEPYKQPVPTAGQVEAATAYLQACLDEALRQQGVRRQSIIRAALSNVAFEVAHAVGFAHPLAEFAPPGMFIDQAANRFAAASECWTSVCSRAVIRPAPRGGYSVWAGAGSLMELSGIRDTYDDAELLAVNSVEHHRAVARVEARKILAGWCGDLPIFGGVLGAEHDVRPIHVHRGPVMAAELGQFASSWDDDASRRACLDREAAGHTAHVAMTHRAVALFREHEHLAPLVLERRPDLEGRLKIVDLELDSGAVIRIMGEVTMRQDGLEPLALVRDLRTQRQYHMALREFITEPLKLHTPAPAESSSPTAASMRPR